MAITVVMTITVKQVVVAIPGGTPNIIAYTGRLLISKGVPQGTHTICECNGCYFTVNILDLPSPSPIAIYS